MARRIAIEPQRCIGCRLCSVACSITKTGAAGLAEARIWVENSQGEKTTSGSAVVVLPSRN